MLWKMRKEEVTSNLLAEGWAEDRARGGVNIVFFYLFFIDTILGKEASHHLVHMYLTTFSLNHTPIYYELDIIIRE